MPLTSTEMGVAFASRRQGRRLRSQEAVERQRAACSGSIDTATASRASARRTVRDACAARFAPVNRAYALTNTSLSVTGTETDTVVGPATAPTGQSATEVQTVDMVTSDPAGASSTTTTQRYYALTGAGLVSYARHIVTTDSTGATTADDAHSYSPPQVDLPPSLTAGQTYTSTDTDTDVSSVGAQSTSTESETLSVTLESNTPQSVTVPAGTFSAYPTPTPTPTPAVRIGALNPNFGVGGIVVQSRPLVTTNDVAVQSDGKTVAVGEVNGSNGTIDFGVTRFNTDGSLDTTFGQDGTVTTDFNGGNDEPIAVAVKPDGTILVAGTTYDVANPSDSSFALARYNSDGSLDTTFGTGGLVVTSFAAAGSTSSDIAQSMAVSASGLIAVCGSSNADGHHRIRRGRLQPQRHPGHLVRRHRKSAHRIPRRR